MSKIRRQRRFHPAILSDELPPSATPPKINKSIPNKKPTLTPTKPRGVDKPKRLRKFKVDKVKSQTESPWKSYGFIDEIIRDGETVTNVRKFVSGKVFAFRVFPNNEKSEVIERQFKILDHHNVLAAEEFFRHGPSFFIRSPAIGVSFDRIILCRQYPSSKVLASMIGQTMDGLKFLVGYGVICDSMTCSTILVTEGGCVKIVAFSDAKIQEHLNASTAVLVRRLASIMILLMQKYENKVGECGIQDRVRWPPQDQACEFLHSLQTAKDLNETIHNHQFITPKARDGQGLIDLVVKTSDTTLDLRVKLSPHEQFYSV